MAVIDRTIPYEILIRFGDDGIVKGGHYQDRRIIEIDGERVKDQPSEAKPLGSSPEAVKALLPGVALTAFAEIDRLNGLIATHDREVDALRDELGAAREAARVAGLEVQRLEVKLRAREATLTVREDDIVRIEVQLEEARQALAETRDQVADLIAPLEEEPV
jgi:chromosome segregation ATPase